MLLGGIDFWNAHRKVEYTSVYWTPLPDSTLSW
jgi:hypothetical protein